MSGPRIALCLIARDEEAMLPACLESVRGAVDETVLVDTGSSDRTIAIARAAGAKVVEQPWADDFSAPRNEALRHATADWILQLDCDERLAPGAARALRAEVARAGPPAGLLPLHDSARLDAPAEEVLSGAARLGSPIWLPRLFRRLPDLRYQDPVHENVDAWLLRHGARVRRVRADILHLGAVPELRLSRGKGDRNLDLLRRRCQASPGDASAWGLLSLELLGAGRAGEARDAAEQGWRRIAAFSRERTVLPLAMARALVQMEAAAWAEALETARAAQARDGRHPDTDWVIGAALLRLAQAPGGERRASLEAAAEAFRSASKGRAEALTGGCLRGTSSWRASLGLGQALLGLGRPAEALDALDAALAERPGLAEARLAVAEARLETGDAAGALALAEPLLSDTPDAWVLAAAAARALGSGGDARLLFARAAERAGRGFVSERLRERFEEMRAIDCSTPTSTPTAAQIRRKFAVTIVSPKGYPHSAAFQEVAEALHHGLRALGYDSVLTSELDLPGRRHLVLGANLLAALGIAPPPDTVLYNLEQVEEGSPWFRPELLDLYRRHEVWDYSRANAEALERLGVRRPRLVPVGHVPELTRIAPAEEDIDVLFYGSMNERRQAVLKDLERGGARVHAAFGVYGAERDRLVARSRLVLNVHFYEAKVFEIVRVSYLLANRRAVVSERGCDAEEERPFERAVAFASYDRIAQTCLDLLRRPEERGRLGEEGYAVMAARPQVEFLREALADG